MSLLVFTRLASRGRGVPPSVFLFAALSLSAAAVQEELAKPAGQVLTPALTITSNIAPGRMYYGDAVGPFLVGQNLIITCSTDGPKSVSLSWWEGDEQLPSVTSAEQGFVSKSYRVGILKKEDSKRHFTCKEKVSGTERSVDLHLLKVYMEIRENGYSLDDEENVDITYGKDTKLECVVKGTHPSTGSWWEGETKLPSSRTVSGTAITSVLLLRPASNEDNGRELTCRAKNGQLVKTVVLNVVKGKNNPATTMTEMAVVLLVALVAYRLFRVVGLGLLLIVKRRMRSST